MGSPDHPEWDAAKLAMSNVSRTLGLADHDQDWGIANGDGRRLEEFAQFLREGDLVATVAFQVVDLVLSSANERLIDGGRFDENAIFGAVAALNRRLWVLQVEYWGALQDVGPEYADEAAEVFPVAPAVRTWFADQDRDAPTRP